MSIRLHLRRALLIAKLRALLALKRLLERVQGTRGEARQRAEVRSPASAPPEMTFDVEPGVVYTPELQAQVRACMRQAADDFLAYGIGKLQRDGTLEPDWPTHIAVNVRSDGVSWALVSRSGHRFAATNHPLSARRH